MSALVPTWFCEGTGSQIAMPECVGAAAAGILPYPESALSPPGDTGKYLQALALQGVMPMGPWKGGHRLSRERVSTLCHSN
jgi:hypothetical protein